MFGIIGGWIGGVKLEDAGHTIVGAVYLVVRGQLEGETARTCQCRIHAFLTPFI
jgi:hypothetical protein